MNLVSGFFTFISVAYPAFREGLVLTNGEGGVESGAKIRHTLFDEVTKGGGSDPLDPLVRALFYFIHQRHYECCTLPKSFLCTSLLKGGHFVGMELREGG